MSTGLDARRATTLTVAEREENFIRTQSVVRWSRDGRAAYKAKREALLFVFFLFDRWNGQAVNATRESRLKNQLRGR